MAYIIDAPALEALACRDKKASRVIGKAIESGKCYITPPTVATAYYAIFEREGEAAAERWLDYATSGSVMKIENRHDRDFLRLVAIARTITKLPLCSRYTAALAHILNAQVITNLSNFEDLAKAKFCRVAWIG